MAEKHDAADLERMVNDGWDPPNDLSDEVKAEIIALVKESNALSVVICALGDRLGAGENAVRKDLNPAIQRQRELGRKLFDLRKQAGFREGPAIMYGPPWSL